MIEFNEKCPTEVSDEESDNNSDDEIEECPNINDKLELKTHEIDHFINTIEDARQGFVYSDSE
jgi:hypothetical protein